MLLEVEPGEAEPPELSANEFASCRFLSQSLLTDTALTLPVTFSLFLFACTHTSGTGRQSCP